MKILHGDYMKCHIFRGLGSWILVDGLLMIGLSTSANLSMLQIKSSLLVAKLSPVVRELPFSKLERTAFQFELDILPPPSAGRYPSRCGTYKKDNIELEYLCSKAAD
jgi:hypothetical protein